MAWLTRIGSAAMVRADFDTNLHIDYLDGVAESGVEIGRYDHGFISVLNNMLLVTRNTIDFPSDDPGVRVPYQR